MKMNIALLLVLLVLGSGCATYHLNKPVVDDGSSIVTEGDNPDLKDAILSGIQLAHPELSREEAELLAKDFFKEHKPEINERYRQTRSLITIARYVSYLINARTDAPIRIEPDESTPEPLDFKIATN